MNRETVIRLLGPERFATFEKACNGNQDGALRLYVWNIAVASAFWGGFNTLEVALRNALHEQLAAFAGQEAWWAEPLPFHDREWRHINGTVKAVEGEKHRGARPGHVVAELNFGFWTGLLANRYHQRLWPILQHAFPHWHKSRKELHHRLESLRKLRNRVAHHEPIFARHLEDDHDRLLEVLEGIAPEAKIWVFQNSRVPDVLSRRAQIIAGTDTTTF